MVVSSSAVRLILMVALVMLAGCGEEPKVDASLDLTRLLGGDSDGGFSQALAVREFSFPADHAAHGDFRNEWWYLTGNLQGEKGRRFGYQVTFFRTGLIPPRDAGPEDMMGTASAWVVENMWMAHGAVTDLDAKTHVADQRFSRSSPGLAGAQSSPFKVWLDDWQLLGDGDNFPWTLRLGSQEFALELELEPLKPMILQGDQGLSRKSDTPGNASYYYSYTRLATSGKLILAGQEHEVQGLSWFDREWSTSTLDRDQSGWNWFSLQLDRGEEMMFFQLLDLEGNPDGNSQGSWIAGNGAKTTLSGESIQLKSLEDWQSPYGQEYPVRWQLDYPQGGESWIIAAPVEGQFMDLAVRYWEGAVEVFDRRSMKKIGHGYLEMTRTQR